MDASSKAEVMKRYVEAFKRKDWDAATEFWADDIVLHAQGRHPLAGDFFGKQAFLDHVGQVSAQLGGTIELVEVYDVMFSTEHAVAWVKERAVRGGAESSVRPGERVSDERRQDQGALDV